MVSHELVIRAFGIECQADPVVLVDIQLPGDTAGGATYVKENSPEHEGSNEERLSQSASPTTARRPGCRDCRGRYPVGRVLFLDNMQLGRLFGEHDGFRQGEP